MTEGAGMRKEGSRKERMCRKESEKEVLNTFKYQYENLNISKQIHLSTLYMKCSAPHIFSMSLPQCE